MANILGIDYGQKYIGYAIGNDITLTSSTQGTIIYKNKQKLFQEIQDLVCLLYTSPSPRDLH